jgi:hypothetical protein
MLLFALFITKIKRHICPVRCLFAWGLVLLCTKKGAFGAVNYFTT